MQEARSDAVPPPRVLCVFNDASTELREVAGYAERPLAHRMVAVPALGPNEGALWLSCDDGQDRWYLYRGSLFAQSSTHRDLLSYLALSATAGMGY